MVDPVRSSTLGVGVSVGDGLVVSGGAELSDVTFGVDGRPVVEGRDVEGRDGATTDDESLGTLEGTLRSSVTNPHACPKRQEITSNAAATLIDMALQCYRK